MFNFKKPTFTFVPLPLTNISYDIVEETQGNVLITKKVLYKADGTEVVFSRSESPIVTVDTIDKQIADLQAKRDVLVKSGPIK